MSKDFVLATRAAGRDPDVNCHWNLVTLGFDLICAPRRTVRSRSRYTTGAGRIPRTARTPSGTTTADDWNY
ncbi:hypothetical protein [Streptomyces sp. NPDC088258]|uniref:hypothetical protein n=1 Tax=Streptomyces sp. NPDC088258 TaxID=3365849 RepID=UPI0037F16A3D